MKIIIIITVFLSTLIFTSCESDQSKKERIEQENQQLIEGNQKREIEEKEEARRLDEVRLEEETRAEGERKEKEIYDRYISNSLNTGVTPYSKYYGGNSSCNELGCSKIKVLTSNSDVVVTIKKNNEVVQHAFIQSGDNYTFSFPNGTYQIFFYYGKGWNPNKEMKGGRLKGGFITNEDFGKDEPQSLYDNILTYELIMQENGNFSTTPSNPEEAL